MIDVDKIIRAAIQKGASDIHLVTGQHPMFRISKALIPYEEVDKLKDEEMFEISDFIINGNVDKAKMYDETRKLDTSYVCDGIRLRVNASYANEIPVFTMRIIKNELPPFEALGVPDVVRRMTYQPQGLILVTGKTNSGKSTTLSALIAHINETQNKKILMLENCIEYNHKSRNSIIIQKEIENDYETYYDGIKNAIKEDCDVLVVEEICDRKTMEAIFEVAEAGILVIGSMNTLTPSKTLEKIKSFYSEKEQSQVEYSIKNLIKVIDSQRIIEGKKDEKELVSEVLVLGKKQENISLIESVAKLYIENKITLKQAKAQLEKSEIDEFNNKIMKMRIFQKKVNV